MRTTRTSMVILAIAVAATAAGAWIGWQMRDPQPATPSPVAASGGEGRDHWRATYDPLHFKPAIDTATDAQCLACHREVLDDTVREASPAGVPAATSKAWYQQLSTYQGTQETFHRRHLLTPMARELMNLRCNTCHQGHDPREEAPGSSATSTPQATTDFTLRKQVDVETTCLKCHGADERCDHGLAGPLARKQGHVRRLLPDLPRGHSHPASSGDLPECSGHRSGRTAECRYLLRLPRRPGVVWHELPLSAPCLGKTCRPTCRIGRRIARRNRKPVSNCRQAPAHNPERPWIPHATGSISSTRIAAAS